MGNLFALLGVIWRRFSSHLTMLFTVWVGFTLVIALVVSIPIFTEAASYRILLQSLAKNDTEDNLSPFAMVYNYGLAKASPITVSAYQQANDAIARRMGQITLPMRYSVRYAATDKLRVMPTSGERETLLWTGVAFLSDFKNHVEVIEGAWPQPFQQGSPLEVLLTEQFVNSQGLLVGDSYIVRSAPDVKPALELPIRVAGIWRPLDTTSPYWFKMASSYEDTFIVPEESFLTALGDPTASWVRYVAWYADFDGSAVRSDDVDRLTGQIGQATAEIRSLLPGTYLSNSPTAALDEHRKQARLLTLTLALFSVPLVAVLGYFIAQMMGMVVSRQQQEIAVLRSRGSSRGQILGLAFGEGLTVSAAALACGVPLGLLTAQLIAWTRSFLHFTPMPGPSIELLDGSWRHGLLMVAVAMPAILAPTLAASRRTIVSFKAERARDTRPPFWQRLYLDFLLLIPALYGYRQLQLQGSISVPGVAAPSDDPFRNPLLLLAPTLMIFALALVSLRAIPLVLSVLAALFDRLPGISLLMALRSLSRTSKVYSGLILLIVLTLSLATFTASMARTLDAHALARATYSTGADIRILDRGTQLVVARPNEVAPIPIPPISQGGAVPGAPVREALPAGSYRYSFMPLDEYLSYSGVEAVTRIGRSKVSVTGDASREGTFIGVDRLTLPQVIQEGWQPSYAAESLGALMNLLGEVPSGVLISERHAAEYGLKRGDRIKLDMNEFGQVASVPLIVVGVINYFPTVYPEDGAFFVGNLDYAFDMQGGAYPHEIWMQTTPEAHVEDIIKANISRGMNTTAYERPEDQLEETLLRPERQGLFGLLSVGFLALVLVSVVGFLVYTLRSFQRRLVEMGILRAIGLTVTQLATLLICEQALVIGAGTVFGTLIGVSVSRLFMPFLQVRSDQHPDTPPFVVQIAWDQIALVYLAVGGLLLVTVCVTLVLLRRMRIFEAVKLGEAV